MPPGAAPRDEAALLIDRIHSIAHYTFHKPTICQGHVLLQFLTAACQHHRMLVYMALCGDIIHQLANRRLHRQLHRQIRLIVREGHSN